MTDFPADPTVPSDAELISAVPLSAGDNDAYGALFERHRDAARRMALQVRCRGRTRTTSSPRPSSRSSTSPGPELDQDMAFRAYLLTAIRRLHIDRIRAERRVQPTDDLEKYDGGVEFDDTAVAAFEAGSRARVRVPARAVAAGPVAPRRRRSQARRHRSHAGHDGQRCLRARVPGPRGSAPVVPPGFHLSDTAEEQCRWTTEHLGAYVRQGLGKRDTARVRDHLDECARCTAVYLELVEVNSGLRGLLAPLLLGAAGTGYVAAMRGEDGGRRGGRSRWQRCGRQRCGRQRWQQRRRCGCRRRPGVRTTG